MRVGRRQDSMDWLGLVLVFLLALATRAGYLSVAADNGFADAPFVVQGGSLNLTEYPQFGVPAPLSTVDEPSAHTAPGYAWLLTAVSRLDAPAAAAMRWLQCALGAMTAACYFFFARRCFGSALAALLAGLFAAVHPFWIINTAELNDGVLASFLLALALVLGGRAGQEGGAFTSLLFGLSLAALALVRAALLPFALVGSIWFLWRCRSLKMGWFYALLAILGFGNGLAPWAVRNFQLFGEPVPVADSGFLHLWQGNHPEIRNGQPNDEAMQKTLGPERMRILMEEPNQSKRYTKLAEDWLEDLKADPAKFISQRARAGLAFLFGESWLQGGAMGMQGGTSSNVPRWLSMNFQSILLTSLLAMLFLGGLGWRFSFGWRKESRLATLAAVWIPLPYFLSHAETFLGPRLPLDGLLLSYSALALAALWPGTPRVSDDGE